MHARTHTETCCDGFSSQTKARSTWQQLQLRMGLHRISMACALRAAVLGSHEQPISGPAAYATPTAPAPDNHRNCTLLKMRYLTCTDQHRSSWRTLHGCSSSGTVRQIVVDHVAFSISRRRLSPNSRIPITRNRMSYPVTARGSYCVAS
jgi:hypothetical protein